MSLLITADDPPVAGAELLFPQTQITYHATIVAEMIAQEYAGREVTYVTVLDGATYWAADVVPRIRQFTRRISAISDTIRIKRTKGTTLQEPFITKDLEYPIAGRHAVILEDIIDEGLVLQFLIRLLQSRGVTSISISSMSQREQDTPVILPVRTYPSLKFGGKRWAVGRGLDVEGRYRDFPDMWLLAEPDQAQRTMI